MIFKIKLKDSHHLNFQLIVALNNYYKLQSTLRKFVSLGGHLIYLESFYDWKPFSMSICVTATQWDPKTFN